MPKTTKIDPNKEMGNSVLYGAQFAFMDSASLADSAAWKDADDVKDLRPEKIWACGFIISEGDDHITIASHFSDGEVAGELTIPKCAVVGPIKRWKVKR